MVLYLLYRHDLLHYLSARVCVLTCGEMSSHRRPHVSPSGANKMVSEPSCDHALYIDVLQPVGPCIPGVKPRSCPKPWSLPVSPAIRAEWLKVKQRGKPRSFPISPREKQMWKEALKQGR